MKTQNNTEIGKRGEEIAAEFLKKQGVDIIEKNYHLFLQYIRLGFLNIKFKVFIISKMDT